MQYFLLAFIFPPILTQYVADLGMKPDVTFGDENDRYDLTSMIDRQQGSFVDVSSGEFRRQQKEDLPKESEEDKRLFRSQRRDGFSMADFAYHDNMESGEGGTIADFEDSLKKFKLPTRRVQQLVDLLHAQGGRKVGGRMKWRRSNVEEGSNDGLEKDLLMHYAVPVEMKINGYLRTPVVE